MFSGFQLHLRMNRWETFKVKLILLSIKTALAKFMCCDCSRMKLVCVILFIALAFSSGYQTAVLPKKCALLPLLRLSDHLPFTCQLAMNEGEAVAHNDTLKIIPVSSEVEFSTVVDFVSRAFGGRHNGCSVTGCDCGKIIGVVGDLDSKTAIILHTLSSRANLSLMLVSTVAPSTFQPTTHLALPNLLDMNPLIHYTEALAVLLDQLNWTRIGLISDATPYFEFAAELLQQKLFENPERVVTPFVRIGEQKNTSKTILTFSEYETDVAVILARDEIACSMIKEAIKHGLKWPQYAWILLDLAYRTSPQTCREDGIILVKDYSVMVASNYSYVRCGPRVNTKFLQSAIFEDSVIAISLEDRYSFAGVTNEFKVRKGSRLTNISFIHVKLPDVEEVAVYDAESEQLHMLNPFAGEQPRGTILKTFFSDHNVTLHATFVVLLFVLLFTFVTAVFILYIYFRKEPEIKATVSL